MNQIKDLSIFISSPSDVRPERILSESVINRLNREFHSFFHLKPILWEREPLLASQHFQESIVPPHETDIVITILWSTLGRKLPEEKFRGALSGLTVTGTEWEFEDALAAARDSGSPQILVYRKTQPVSALLEDEAALEEQTHNYRQLKDFFSRWFLSDDKKSFSAAFFEFKDSADLEHLLESHLRNILKEKIKNLPKSKDQAEIRWHLGSPFRGLLSFDLEHAPVYFGRTKARNDLRLLLQSQINSGIAMVLVLGASGSGKSSLVKAGLLSDLRIPGMIGNVASIRHSIFRPADANESLLELLAEQISKESALPELKENRECASAKLTAELIQNDPNRLCHLLQNALNKAKIKAKLSERSESKLVIIIDQFEELFTIEEISEKSIHEFICALDFLAKSGLIWIVATMRSDFFDRLEKLPALARLTENGRYLLVANTPNEINQIIQQPAQEAGLIYEIDEISGVSLDQEIMQLAVANPSALPLLSFLLDQLWQRRKNGHILTFDAYRELGGLEGSLGQLAEQTFNTLDSNTRDALPDLLRCLITIGTDGKATSRSTNLAEISKNPFALKITDVFLAQQARLLIADQSTRQHDDHQALSESKIRLAHEAFISHWDRVKAFVARERNDLEIRYRLEHQALIWEKADKNIRESLLLQRGQPLIEALDLYSRWSGQLETSICDYIDASRIGERNRKRKQWATIIGSILIVPLVALIYATLQIANGVSLVEKELKFVTIPAGCFEMGSTDPVDQSYPHEKPVHQVCIKSYGMGKYHITRAQWKKVMILMPDPSAFKNYDDAPVESISWEEIKQFILLMNFFGNKKYRLPTESEYEYTARAGTRTERYWGDSMDDACKHENVSSLERKKDNRDAVTANCYDGYLVTSPVGAFPPNPFGVHDIHGNVWSLMEDCWHWSYEGHPSDGSAWTTGECPGHVVRGGAWAGTPGIIRAADRYFTQNGGRGNDVGFRLAIDVR